MSWQDDIQNIQFEITTGDGKVWYPKLIPNYEQDIEFNGNQYDFIDRAGTLFARRLPRGRSYPLEFAFTGGDNVKIGNAFELSSRDVRSWHIVHPFYGKLLVQPLSIKKINSGFDSTIIQCQVIETIVANQPKQVPDYKDLIEQRQKDSQIATSVALTPLSGMLPIKNVQTAIDITNKISKNVSKVSKLESEYSSYQTFYKNALNELNNGTGITHGYLTQIQGLIDMPSIVTSSIGARFQVLENTLAFLGENIAGMASIGYFEKLFYNLIGATVLQSCCTTLTLQNNGDFQTKSDVLLYVNKLRSNYEAFLKSLYSYEDASFSPDHDLMFSLHILIYETCFYLYQVMFTARQERTYYCPVDTNLILLAHRLYGSSSDENINTIKSTNKIGLSEILNIKKDRAILYYV
jgi:hypothetical protein